MDLEAANYHYDFQKREYLKALYQPRSQSVQDRYDYEDDDDDQNEEEQEQENQTDLLDDDRSRSRGQSIFKAKLKYKGINSEVRFKGTSREHTVETPYQLFKGRRKVKKHKQDDTRSMWDQKNLQQKKNFTKGQIVEALKSVAIEANRINWRPLEVKDPCPQEFFMKRDYKGIHGPMNFDPKTIKNPVDAFKLFFDDEVMKYLLKMTTQKYHQDYQDEVFSYVSGQQPQVGKYKNDFTAEDIEAFVALHLYFAVVQIHSMKDYWGHPTRNHDLTIRVENKEKALLDTKLSKIARRTQLIGQDLQRIMTESEFKHIKEYMRCGPTIEKPNPSLRTTREEIDSIEQVYDFVQLMNSKFKKYFYPCEWLCLDEGMIPFNGKSSFKIFNPQKPCKWGIKEYVLTDGILPYTLKIKLHDTVGDPEVNIENIEYRGKILNLVLEMVEGYEFKSHKLVMDNYYNSPQLYLALKNKEIGALGTLRHNRSGLSKADIDSPYFQKILQDESTNIFYISKDNQLILLYFMNRNSKPVSFITNFVDHQSTSQSINLKSMQCIPKNAEMPQILSFYNKYKGGVDRRNGYNSMMRRRGENETLWWRSVFWRLVETSVINAYVIYKKVNGPEFTFAEFKKQLILELTARYHSTYKIDKPINPNYEHVTRRRWYRKRDGHTLLISKEVGRCTSCKSQRTQQYCTDCSSDLDVKKTQFLCSAPMCIRYHKYNDFEHNLEKARLKIPKALQLQKGITQTCIIQSDIQMEIDRADDMEKKLFGQLALQAEQNKKIYDLQEKMIKKIQHFNLEAKIDYESIEADNINLIEKLEELCKKYLPNYQKKEEYDPIKPIMKASSDYDITEAKQE